MIKGFSVSQAIKYWFYPQKESLRSLYYAFDKAVKDGKEPETLREKALNVKKLSVVERNSYNEKFGFIYRIFSALRNWVTPGIYTYKSLGDLAFEKSSRWLSQDDSLKAIANLSPSEEIEPMPAPLPGPLVIPAAPPIGEELPAGPKEGDGADSDDDVFYDAVDEGHDSDEDVFLDAVDEGHDSDSDVFLDADDRDFAKRDGSPIIPCESIAESVTPCSSSDNDDSSSEEAAAAEAAAAEAEAAAAEAAAAEAAAAEAAAAEAAAAEAAAAEAAAAAETRAAAAAAAAAETRAAAEAAAAAETRAAAEAAAAAETRGEAAAAAAAAAPSLTPHEAAIAAMFKAIDDSFDKTNNKELTKAVKKTLSLILGKVKVEKWEQVGNACTITFESPMNGKVIENSTHKGDFKLKKKMTFQFIQSKEDEIYVPRIESIKGIWFHKSAGVNVYVSKFHVFEFEGDRCISLTPQIGWVPILTQNKKISYIEDKLNCVEWTHDPSIG